MKELTQMSNCCMAPFTEPGYPDSDICSECFEHADIQKDVDENRELKADLARKNEDGDTRFEE
tara:strand:+ start:191 stop:379 length:189 start_codon:yes stop_codon:yes gene_type:complete